MKKHDCFPDFFIVGAPKCGTTSLYHYLKQHPQIFMPDLKEPRYFSTDLNVPSKVENFKNYLNLFKCEKEGLLLGEATPLYLYSKKACKEIHEFNPNAKIIIILRNPVDFLRSLYNQRLYSGIENAKNIYEIIEAELKGISITRNSSPMLLPMVMIRFSQNIKRYFDTFGREQVLIIVLDDLRSNPAEVYRSILRFLDVDTGFKPTFEVQNAAKTFKNNFLGNFLNSPIPKPFRSIVKKRLPTPLHKICVMIFKNIWGTLTKPLKKANTRFETTHLPPIKPELRQRLQIELELEINQLSKILNRDLISWMDETSQI